MKKLFAFFCAFALMPTFSTYAWIGGPFSNNSYFGENGDDGVYEAVGFPTSGLTNGVGIFRWAVANDVVGVTDDDVVSTSTVTFDNQGNIVSTFVNILPATSNIYFGGLNRISHSWFIEGVSYTGFCNGTVNSGIGFISCVGNAVAGTGTDSVSSGFTGEISNSGPGLPSKRFDGEGSGAITSGATVTNFLFGVFGSRVSTRVVYNGVSGS